MVNRARKTDGGKPSPGRPVVLIIMDGWGVRAQKAGNAIASARKPFFDSLWKNYPHSLLKASGEAVGLPAGYMGNSEVGHTHIGAGRAVPQEFVRVNGAIRDGSFFRNKTLLTAISHAKRRKQDLHLMGLLSDGGVHSHISHLFALLKLAKRRGMEDHTFVHCFLDGRDVPPKSARRYILQLQDFMRKQGIGEIASIMGRYYAMDRDNRWNREHKAYDALVNRKGYVYESALKALEASYSRGETDEFVKPSMVRCAKHGIIHDVTEGDSIIFYNFRSDRAREITKAFVEGKFNRFTRRRIIGLDFVCLVQYDKRIRSPVAFPPLIPDDTLGEAVSKRGLRQLRIAETEKYAHVTYFFNNGREKPFPKEDRILVPSPKVTTYDKTPAMSAPIITRRAIAEIGKYPFIVINFANADMVGHTGKFKRIVEAIETIDRCLCDIVTAVLAKGGRCLITADHGNAEEKFGEHQTSHTTNPVPFMLISDRPYRLKPKGTLQNVAPTALDLLGLPKPEVMVDSLIIR